MKILLTGGTGFLGSHLLKILISRGHSVILVTRNAALALKPQPFQVVIWPPKTPIEIQTLQDCEVVINLAGEPLARGRWSKAQKLSICNSRVEFTGQLVDVLRGSIKMHTILSSSAIGFYGDRKTEILTEDSPAGEGFLAEVCRNWEAPIRSFELSHTVLRKVLLRTGIVLHRSGGILKELEPIYRNWLGGPLGNGEQMMSWIHLEDWLNAVMFCLSEKQIVGPVNLVAPEPVSNRTFSALYASVFKPPFKPSLFTQYFFKKPWQLPVPKLALEVLLGEKASLALDSQNVRPEKLQNLNFKFKFWYLREALENLYGLERGF